MRIVYSYAIRASSGTCAPLFKNGGKTSSRGICIYIVDRVRCAYHAVHTSYKHEGRAMRAKVKKWGNSAAVRIPASVMQATRLDFAEVVDGRDGADRDV